MRTDDIYRLLASLRLFAPDAASQTNEAIENLLGASSTLSLVDHGLLGQSGARAALSQSQHFDLLTQLDLSHNALGDAGVTLLFQGLAGRRSQLHTVRLASCSITDVGLLSIIMHNLLPGPPRLPQLRQLFLNNNRIELLDPAAALLASALSHRHSQLRRLNLTSNPIKGLRAFLRSLTPRTLQILQLNACGLMPEDCVALFEWLRDPAIPVVRLELNANRLTAAVMELFTTRLLETGLCHLELLANDEPMPPLVPARAGPYEMASPDLNRFYAQQLQREALGLLPIARIVSQARPLEDDPPEWSFPLLRLPVELRQRIVLMTQTTALTPFHRAVYPHRRLGTYLAQSQYVRIWTYASDRGTLFKSSQAQRARFRTEDDREQYLADEKESFLFEVRCLKLEDKANGAGDT